MDGERSAYRSAEAAAQCRIDVSAPELGDALATAARQAGRAAGRHDLPAARALHDALRAAASRGEAPDREWIAQAIRDAATWATDDADVPLLAALGALARAAGR